MVNAEAWAEEARQVAQQYLVVAARKMSDAYAQVDSQAVETKDDEEDDDGAIAAGMAVAVAGVIAAAETLKLFVKGQLATVERTAKGLAAVANATRAFPRTHGFSQLTNVAHRAAQVTAEEIGQNRSLLSATVGRYVERVWHTRHDDRVRETHAAADGQVRPVGEPFEVGDALLRYPGDPEGPPGETINCRCRLTYRRKRT